MTAAFDSLQPVPIVATTATLQTALSFLTIPLLIWLAQTYR